jgi:class 3 adenylate cyclase/tetratricopeptide (TPR) repeat protein
MEGASLVCPSCSKANPGDMRFCGYCGSALPLLCPSCGRSVPEGMSFCGYCGVPLSEPFPASPASTTRGPPVSDISRSLPAAVSTTPDVLALSPAPAQEERRLVTALFCDLVGFTPLSDQLDPEEVRDIQADYFRAMSQQIERYGGTVEKYAGDAVLALFGAPVAHEDDAERAVLCALGMQATIEPVAMRARTRWQVEPSIRVGVNTGEVVSGVWEAGGRQDVAVTGDAVNTAARIQAAAEPGEVLVGTETMRLTQRRIAFGEKRDLVLKGKAGTVPAYPALGLREQMGERWETSQYVTPLVGREREMGELVDAWRRAQEGDGQLVTLVGDAGVGKSRLVAELLKKVTNTSTLRIVRGRCLSYGQQISLWLIADLLRGLFGMRERDALEEVQAKLRAGVVGLLVASDSQTQAEALDVLGEALGILPGNSRVASAGAEVRRQALIRSLRLLLGVLSERAPALVVLEDLHWIDEASEEVLSEVLADVPGLRLLVIAAQRPGWTAPWSEWGWPERLVVRPLREEEAAMLAGAVLRGTSLSPELERYVADRAGGNPFFVEEMLRALQEAGDLVQHDGQMDLVAGAAERLPSTLTEVLLARLDRLEGQARSVAQVGSVIGRSFGVRLLAEVVGQDITELDAALTALQRAEIAFPHGGSDPEYAFKHVSMREAAYNTLVHRRRQELHLATARAIAALYPLDEYVEMIAYHYARTEEQREAVTWLERAGDRAAGVYANETAIGYYREARKRLEMLSAEPTVLARVDEKLGLTLYSVGHYDQALEALERAVKVYRQVRDLETAGRTMALIGRVHRYRGTPEEGLARLQPMVEMLAWSGPSKGLAALHIALARLHFLRGNYRQSLEESERGAEIARAIDDERLRAEAEERQGTALILLGQTEQGRQVLEGVIPVAEAVGDLDIIRVALNNLGDCYRLLGDLEAARQYNERSREAAERMGDPAYVLYALMNLGEVLIDLGDWPGAREYLERATEVLRSVESTAFAAYPPLMLGRLCLAEGDWDAASQNLQEGLTLAEGTGDRQALERAQTHLAELDQLEGRPEEALARLEPLIQEDAQLGAMLPAVGTAYLELGDVARAAEVAEDAVRRAREQHERLALVDALRVQGMVLIRQEDYEEARRVLDEALELAQAMPHPYAEARIAYQDGVMQRRRGEHEQARGQLQGALAIFHRLGASKDVERTEQVLTELATV